MDRQRLRVVNFTFTLLDEGAIAQSSEGNYDLAIIKQRESYESLYIALQDIRSEMQSLNSIEVGGQTYTITYLGAYLATTAELLMYCSEWA